MRNNMGTHLSSSKKSKSMKNRKPLRLNAQEAIEKYLSEITKKAV